jgi:hypothetical protein
MVPWEPSFWKTPESLSERASSISAGLYQVRGGEGGGSGATSLGRTMGTGGQASRDGTGHGGLSARETATSRDAELDIASQGDHYRGGLQTSGGAGGFENQPRGGAPVHAEVYVTRLEVAVG